MPASGTAMVPAADGCEIGMPAAPAIAGGAALPAPPPLGNAAVPALLMAAVVPALGAGAGDELPAALALVPAVLGVVFCAPVIELLPAGSGP